MNASQQLPRAAGFSLRDRVEVEAPTHSERVRTPHLRTGVVFALLAAMIVTGSIAAADQSTPAPPKGKTMPAPPAASDEQAGRKEAFEKAMTNVVLKGTWRMTGKDGTLTEPRDEQYAIISVSKGFADNWVISARMRFGSNDVTMPFPVRVVWAGDTPIITVDDFAVPGVGTYSARVMIYRDYYCGSWFGKGYSGIMTGRIVPADEAEEKPEAPSEGAPNAQGKTQADESSTGGSTQ